MPNPKTVAIACLPVGGGYPPPYRQPQAHETATCDTCGRKVWLSTKSHRQRAHYEGQGTRVLIYCNPCAVVDMRKQAEYAATSGKRIGIALDGDPTHAEPIGAAGLAALATIFAARDARATATQKETHEQPNPPDDQV